MSAFGTRLLTWWKGELVGRDQFGNSYFREKGGDRRWVIYRGRIEASKVPPEWHAWLHRITDEIPKPEPRREWQREHVPNLTGTPFAYRPAGHIERGRHARATGEYQPWRPSGGDES
jgi:NADH:ubiquinone oxidoreductase subunit